MAAPITSIIKNELTTEEVQQQKLAELQRLLAEQDQAIEKVITITAELNDSGLLDAMHALLHAKEQLTEIMVKQASKDQMINLMNHVMNASNLLTSMDPAITSKIGVSVNSGFQEAELTMDNDKLSVFQLMKALNDPDINRAVKYGLHFLRGMGKGLGEGE